MHVINASEYMLLFKMPMNSQKLLENEYRTISEAAQNTELIAVYCLCASPDRDKMSCILCFWNTP